MFPVSRLRSPVSVFLLCAFRSALCFAIFRLPFPVSRFLSPVSVLPSPFSRLRSPVSRLIMGMVMHTFLKKRMFLRNQRSFGHCPKRYKHKKPHIAYGQANLQ
jgi:hypothetical protein